MYNTNDCDNGDGNTKSCGNCNCISKDIVDRRLERESQKDISNAIDYLVKAISIHPTFPVFLTEESMKMHKYIDNTIKKLEYWHDELNTMSFTKHK